MRQEHDDEVVGDLQGRRPLAVCTIGVEGSGDLRSEVTAEGLELNIHSGVSAVDID
jgi:hypothetical protein